MSVEGGGPPRVALSGPARGWLVALALLLAGPTALLRLQDEGALEAFHNRTLAPWPAARRLPRDPAGYFAAANSWLADRVYPIVRATYGKNQLAYSLLHLSPAANVTVAGGFVFLNGTDAGAEDDLVRTACLGPAEPGARARLEAALGRLAAFGRRRGLGVDVLMVPTVPTLYGDRLPRSIPAALRAACAAAPAGRAPLAGVGSPPGLHFVYPFAALSARRDDPAMFPMGDFHPEGLSVKLATDGYLAAVGAPAPALSLALGEAPSEVLADHGVAAPFPVYAVRGSGAAEDPAATAAVQAAMQPFYAGPGATAYVYRDAAAPSPEGVLMLSDSYGYNQAISFAAAFRTVVQTTTPDRDPAGLLDAVGAIVPFRRLVLVFNDSNSGRVGDFADMLPADPG